MSERPVIVVSGGMGSSGSQLVHTALAQFETNDISVVVVPQVRDPQALEAVVTRAAAEGGIVVHTLVDAALRRDLIERARAQHVVEIDLIGPLLHDLSGVLGQTPAGKPGLYRKMHESDVRRIEAIEFAVAHDDGKRAAELDQAEIVLAGVSRVGKTPLSMYLSTMGWKVANVPIVRDVVLPPELFRIDPRRVIGLTIEPGQLVSYRQRRGHHLGIRPGADYTAPDQLLEELEYARGVCRRGNFAIVDTTDKPIEECADEILGQINRRLKLDHR